MDVFVCYEINYGDCCNGWTVETLTVYNSADKALNWVCARILKGQAENFVMDEEDPWTEKGAKEQLEKGSFSLRMYYSQQGSEDGYDIIVVKREVQ